MDSPLAVTQTRSFHVRTIVVVTAALLVTVLAVATFSSQVQSNVSITTSPTTTQLAASTCSRDTGGTCFSTDCYPWRKHATCSWGQCVCPDNMCGFQGSCIPPSLVPPPTGPTCNPNTGGTCAVLGCDSWRGATCSGFSFGFTTGITLGQCICPVGQCSQGGKCIKSPEFYEAPSSLNTNNIICPVLASLYNAGVLVTNANGAIERLALQRSISEGLGASDLVGWFFGQTTAGFRADDPSEKNFAMEPLATSISLFKDNATQEASTADNRYLNVFNILQNPSVLHQVAAAVRGGPLNRTQCPVFPCISRFDEFFADFADSQGRIYSKQLGNIAGNIYKNGYHGVAASVSLFTLTQGLTGREFLALAGTLAAFGRKDENGNSYLSVDDLRVMSMHGVFPKDWTKRWWGFKDVLDIIGAWGKQGVPGLAEEMKGPAELLLAVEAAGVNLGFEIPSF